MIVRGIDSNNDWLFGKGKNDYKKQQAAVTQCVKTRLQEFLGDCFFNRTAGVDWWNLLGGKDIPTLKLKIATVILNSPLITGLIELSAVLDSNRKITISYSATTSISSVLASNVINATTSLILTEGDDILTTEDGSGLEVG